MRAFELQCLELRAHLGALLRGDFALGAQRHDRVVRLFELGFGSVERRESGGARRRLVRLGARSVTIGERTSGRQIGGNRHECGKQLFAGRA